MKKSLKLVVMLVFMASVLFIPQTNEIHENVDGMALLNASCARESVVIYVDGKLVNFPDMKPFINEDDRTMVPVRFVSESLGADVSWNQQWQYAKILKNGNDIQIPIGEEVIIKNGQYYDMDTAAILENDRTMVPIRFVSEHLGAKVDWDGKTNSVFITTGVPDHPIIDTTTDKAIVELRAQNPSDWDEVMDELDEIIADPSVRHDNAFKGDDGMLFAISSGDSREAYGHDIAIIQYGSGQEAKTAITASIAKIIGMEEAKALIEKVIEYCNSMAPTFEATTWSEGNYDFTLDSVGPGYTLYAFDEK